MFIPRPETEVFPSPETITRLGRVRDYGNVWADGCLPTSGRSCLLSSPHLLQSAFVDNFDDV